MEMHTTAHSSPTTQMKMVGECTLDAQPSVHSGVTEQLMVKQCIREPLIYANLTEIQPMVQRFLRL